MVRIVINHKVVVVAAERESATVTVLQAPDMP